MHSDINTTQNRAIDKRQQILRAKFLIANGEGMSNSEIMEFILYRTQPNVRQTVYRLIDKLGSITKIFNANIYDLKSVEGVNDAVVISILCMKEILKRMLQEEVETLPIVNNWQKLINYLKVSVGTYNKINFRVIYLNKKYRVIADELQNCGTVDGAPLYIRNIIKRALSLRATSLIVSHNHLSGNVRPSEDDINITKKLSLACHCMQIEFLDHIIVTPKRYFSFKEKGLL